MTRSTIRPPCRNRRTRRGAQLATVVARSAGSARDAPQGPRAGPSRARRVAARVERGGTPPPINWPSPPLPDGPIMTQSAMPDPRPANHVTKGLSHPWAMAFLPDGAILVDRTGRSPPHHSQRRADPTPVAGLPAVAAGLNGLLDIALHPQCDEPVGLFHVPQACGRRRRGEPRRRRPAGARRRAPGSRPSSSSDAAPSTGRR